MSKHSGRNRQSFAGWRSIAHLAMQLLFARRCLKSTKTWRKVAFRSAKVALPSRSERREWSLQTVPGRVLVLPVILGLLGSAAAGQTVNVAFNNLALPNSPIDPPGYYPYNQIGYGDSGLTHYGADGSTFLGNFWNGSQYYTSAPGAGYSAPNSNGYFSSGGVFFNNSYVDWGGGEYSWTGWSYSDVRDTTMSGFYNQYAAYPGSAVGSAGTYAVAYLATSPGLGATVIPTITLPNGVQPQSISIANTTYAALSMLDGDSFAGPSYQDTNGWLSLSIQGYNISGVPTTTRPLTIYLADYRNPSDRPDDPIKSNFVLSSWETVGLTTLGANVHTLQFSMSSSDTDPIYGVNTPAYFAVGSLSFSASCAYWTGAQGTNWGDTAGTTNWSPGGVPGGAGATVIFGEQSATSSTIVDLHGPRTVGGLTFEADTSTTLENTVAGAALTLDNSGSASPIDVAGTHSLGSAVVLNNDAAVEVFGSAGQLTISGAVSGSGAIELNGAGALILSSTDNTYSGGTIVSSGTLEAISPRSLPDGSALIVGSEATTILGDSPAAAALAHDMLAAVPEPGMLTLLAAGGFCIVAARILKRKERPASGLSVKSKTRSRPRWACPNGAQD